MGEVARFTRSEVARFTRSEVARFTRSEVAHCVHSEVCFASDTCEARVMANKKGEQNARGNKRSRSAHGGGAFLSW